MRVLRLKQPVVHIIWQPRKNLKTAVTACTLAKAFSILVSVIMSPDIPDDKEMSDFQGLPTRIIKNALISLEYLAEAGPRIVRLSAFGKENLFADIPNKVSTIYGLKTLGVMVRFLLHRFHVSRINFFQKTLSEVVSRHYHDAIFHR